MPNPIGKIFTLLALNFLANLPMYSVELVHLAVKKSYHHVWYFIHFLRNLFHKITLKVIVTPYLK
jgi:hypothetical protein